MTAMWSPKDVATTVPLLEVEDLRTYFYTRQGVIQAVDGVSFSLRPGRIMGLVGESGSGKSAIGSSIMGLIDPPGRVVSGAVRFKGRDLTSLSREEMRQIRGSDIALICQDPMMALNPVLRVGAQLMETVLAHASVSRQEARRRCVEILGRVGISSPEQRMDAFPHQFSGGMRQRVAIAMALVNRPSLIIADEPTTALDVTIQGQIVSEVQRLCRDDGLALIWITHDLALVSSIADDLCVLYAGRVVEHGPADEVLARPTHPYTRGLLDSIPAEHPYGELPQIPGSAPMPINLPPGCSFLPRCQRALPGCRAPVTLDPVRSGVLARCVNPILDGAHL